jgi:hypothetical protein
MNAEGFGTTAGTSSKGVTFSPNIKNAVEPAEETFTGTTAAVIIVLMSFGPLLANSIFQF